jgi:hypothetical protein
MPNRRAPTYVALLLAEWQALKYNEAVMHTVSLRLADANFQTVLQFASKTKGEA